MRQWFLAHRGNADVVRHKLVSEKGIKVSLRTVRVEMPPSRQVQADLGQCVALNDGKCGRVHLAVLTLG